MLMRYRTVWAGTIAICLGMMAPAPWCWCAVVLAVAWVGVLVRDVYQSWLIYKEASRGLGS